MPSHPVRTVPPRGERISPAISTDRAALASFEEDAARSRGEARGVVRPRSEAEIAELLLRAGREGTGVLAQGARSSLTAGATPRGDLVLALEGLEDFELVGRSARVGPGVRLRDLNERLAPAGLWFPPVPTYDLCCVGGAVATNAAGAATFKHGAVRPWVRALRVVLACGEVLAIRRGEVLAAGRRFEIETSAGTILVPLPGYTTPDLKKISCGYFVREDMDLVDLFVGSEGTLGVVTEVELALAPRPAAIVMGLASFRDDSRALAFTRDVRDGSRELNVRSIEWVDAASLELLRTRGKASDAELPPPGWNLVLWEQELAEALEDESAALALGKGLAGEEAPAGAARALSLVGALLAKHGAADDARIALPHDEAGRRAISRLREVVPETVNELVAERKRGDPGVRKVAGDMVVPFERLEEMLGHYHAAFEKRGLARAIWGHVSDGNLHPNVLARSARDAALGEEALLELGDLARALGGAPLSEHGVGKSPTKQALLRRFLGGRAVEDMVRLKRAVDPRGILAPGNIFPAGKLES